MDKLIELGCNSDWNAIVGLLSVFVASLALYFTIIEQRKSQKHRELSAKVYIKNSFSYIEENDTVSWYITNCGKEIAEVTSFEWISPAGDSLNKHIDLYDSTSINHFWNKLLSENLGFIIHAEMHLLHPESLMVSNKRYTILSLQFEEGKIKCSSRIFDAVKNIRLTIKYTDIYENPGEKELNLGCAHRQKDLAVK